MKKNKRVPNANFSLIIKYMSILEHKVKQFNIQVNRCSCQNSCVIRALSLVSLFLTQWSYSTPVFFLNTWRGVPEPPRASLRELTVKDHDSHKPSSHDVRIYTTESGKQDTLCLSLASLLTHHYELFREKKNLCATEAKNNT